VRDSLADSKSTRCFAYAFGLPFLGGTAGIPVG
jgi:hypothetical protein